jgi:hypothetical protein
MSEVQGATRQRANCGGDWIAFEIKGAGLSMFGYCSI